MSLTLTAARDEILSLINTAWTTNVVPLGYEALIFQDNTQPRPEDVDGSGNVKNWGRAAIQHIDGFQPTLVSDTGSRRFRRLGVVTVEIYSRQGLGFSTSDLATQAILDSMEGVTTAGGVIFTQVRPLELGATGPWVKVNVLAAIEYDEVK